MNVFRIIASVCVAVLFCIGVFTMLPTSPITVLGLPILAIVAGALSYMGLMNLENTLKQTQANTNAAATEDAQYKLLKSAAGINAEEIIKQVRDARAKLKAISDVRVRLSDAQEITGLAKLVKAGEDIIGEILHDPKDFRTARSFFNTQLDQILTIATKYEQLRARHKDDGVKELAVEFQQTVDQTVAGFNGLIADMRSNDKTELQIEMEVLKDQIKIDNR